MSPAHRIRPATAGDAEAISAVLLAAGLDAGAGFLGAERIEAANRGARIRPTWSRSTINASSPSWLRRGGRRDPAPVTRGDALPVAAVPAGCAHDEPDGPDPTYSRR